MRWDGMRWDDRRKKGGEGRWREMFVELKPFRIVNELRIDSFALLRKFLILFLSRLLLRVENIKSLRVDITRFWKSNRMGKENWENTHSVSDNPRVTLRKLRKKKSEKKTVKTRKDCFSTRSGSLGSLMNEGSIFESNVGFNRISGCLAIDPINAWLFVSRIWSVLSADVGRNCFFCFIPMSSLLFFYKVRYGRMYFECIAFNGGIVVQLRPNTTQPTFLCLLEGLNGIMPLLSSQKKFLQAAFVDSLRS